jgi:putative phosphoesterase
MINKIAIISDVHSNLPALESVLNDIDQKGITQIYCLGDLVGYYCFFNEVVDLIKKREIKSLLGNHDYALINTNGIIERSRTCTNVLKWQLERMTQETSDYLKSLKPLMEIEFSNKKIQLVHAGIIDPVDEYLYDVNDEYLKNNNFANDVLISGHTHLIAYKKLYSGKMWINPGSVGQPRDFNNKASYAILDENFNVEFVRVEYDFNKTITAMKNHGFDDYIAEGLTNGKKIGYKE